MKIPFFRTAAALLCSLVLHAPSFAQETKKPSFKYHFVISAYDRQNDPLPFFDQAVRTDFGCSETIQNLVVRMPEFGTHGDFIKFTCVHTDERFKPLSRQPKEETHVCFHNGAVFACANATGREPFHVWGLAKEAAEEFYVTPSDPSPVKPLPLSPPTGLRFPDPSKN